MIRKDTRKDKRMAKEKVPSEKDTKTDSEKLLERAVAEVRKKWGSESIWVPGQEIKIDHDVLPTGIAPLDEILGNGGLAKGTIVEAFGLEGSGKSTICLQIISEAQKSGIRTLFVDQEHALDSEYAEAVGVDLSKMFIAQPGCMEEALGIVETMVSTGEVGLVVVDSLASLVPQAEIDRPLEEQTMGIQARLMSTWLRRFNPIISSTDTILIFTNQLRDKMSYGGGTTTPGGRAVKFYASYRIEVKVIDKIPGPEGHQIGNRLRLTAVKNKKFSPYRKTEVSLLFGEGIDVVEMLIGECVNFGLILSKTGGWYSFNPDYVTIPEGTEGFNAKGQLQGKATLKQFLVEHEDILKLLEDTVSDYKSMGVL